MRTQGNNDGLSDDDVKDESEDDEIDPDEALFNKIN